MTQSLDYYFGLYSPWSYLGHRRIEAIAKAHGAQINYYPVNVPRIFSVTGGLPLGKRAPARQALRMQELIRWRDYLKIDLVLEPAYFPVSDKLAAGTVIAAAAQGHEIGDLCHAYMRACWAEERDISNPLTVEDILTDEGFDAAALRSAAETADVEAKWEADTDKAIAAGVIGAPTYVIGDQVLWGQDRLMFVERLLA